MRRVAGRVTFEGKPVAGGAVRLESSGIVFLAPRSLLADAQGRFDFGPQPARRFTVSAAESGKTAAVEELDLRDPRARTDSLELQLSGCEDRLTGRVFDPEGGMIVSARVRTHETFGSETDERGVYELCLPRGMSQVVIDASGYARLRATVVALGRTVFDVVLSPEATVVGQVVLRGTREGVAGARVALIPSESGRVQPATVWADTDSTGRFRVGVAPGEHAASATAEGLSSLELVPVTALVGLDSEALTLELSPLSTLRGKVMSAGKAVAGARVIARSAIGHAEAISQLDGRFVMDMVVPGELTFTASPWEVVSPTRFPMERAEEFVELEVKRLGSVKGTVTRQGKPVAQAFVTMSSRAHPSLVVETDSEGRYEIAGVAAGNWSIGAQCERVGAFTEGTTLALAAAEDKVLDLELDLAASIAGTVRTEQGAPVPGVFVHFKMKRNGDQGQSLTDEKGRFSCTAMSGGGEYVPRVFPSAGSRTSFTPARGASFPAVTLVNRSSHVEGVELVIKYERLDISGRVVDARGESVPDVRVSAASVEGGMAPVFPSWAVLPSAVTDTRGAFVIRPLTGGTWGIKAMAPDGAQAVVPGVAAGAKDVTIKLQSRGGIEGTLVGYGERPVVHVQPTTPNSAPVQAQVRGDAFSVHVPAGTYVVTAMSRREGDAQRVEVREGERTRVTLTNRGRATVAGVVTEFRSRTPVAGLRCHAVVAAAGQAGSSYQGLEAAPTTDEQGAFQIDSSPAGEISVACFSNKADFSSGCGQTPVAPGGRVSVELVVVRRALSGVMGDLGLVLDLRSPVAIVLGIKQGSPAEGQLAVGDVIVAIDNEPTVALCADGVQALISNHSPGDRVSVAVRRGNETKSFALVVASRP